MNKKRKIEILNKELRRLPAGTLHLKRSRNYTAFVHYRGAGNIHNINTNEKQIYRLARKKYLQAYIPSIESGDRSKVDKILKDFVDANLDLHRITLSADQYEWMHEPYYKNPSRPEELTHSSIGHTATRSKSEKSIASTYDLLGVPYRYECAMTIDVLPLVNELARITKDYRQGKKLFHYSGGSCYWNVPPELDWMNNSGSIWLRYNSRDGTITIFPDFTIRTLDEELIIHEHEGLAISPLYRSNASERIFVMRETGTVSEQNLLTTFECDIKNQSDFDEIVRRRILTRI